jgi:hypothetical protein
MFRCEVGEQGCEGKESMAIADQSVQGTSVPGRSDSASSTVEPAISVGIRACRRAAGGARSRKWMPVVSGVGCKLTLPN